MRNILTICFISTLIFPIKSFLIYKIDNNNENDRKRLLKNILYPDDNQSSSPEYQQQFQRADDESFDLPLGKSIFVKRIIPHGYQTGKYEYDSVLKTLFKPQVRLHIRKPMDQHENEVLKSMELDGRNEAINGSNPMIVIVKKDREKTKKMSTSKDVLRQIKKLLKKYVGKGKKNFKKRFVSLLDAFIRGYEQKHMRSDKSGEEHDPYAPGKIPKFLENEKTTRKPKKKKFYPEYPYWNWWTYKKNVVQDRCKGGLVMNGNAGNICVSKIGHRRNIWDAIKNFFNGPKKKKNPATTKKPAVRNATLAKNAVTSLKPLKSHEP